MAIRFYSPCDDWHRFSLHYFEQVQFTPTVNCNRKEIEAVHLLYFLVTRHIHVQLRGAGRERSADSAIKNPEVKDHGMEQQDQGTRRRGGVGHRQLPALPAIPHGEGWAHAEMDAFLSEVKARVVASGAKESACCG
jgi:hypothetical protein